MPLLIFFTVWGLLELLLLIKLASTLGIMAMIGFLLLSALAGGVIIRRQQHDFARQVLRMQQLALATSTLEAVQVREGICRLLAGGLLIVPGVISDLFALCLLLPMLRRIFGSALLRAFKPDVVVRRFGWYEVSCNVYEHDATADVRRKDDATS